MKLSVRHRASISSKFPSPLQKMETSNMSGSKLGDLAGETDAPDDEDRSHPVEPRSKIAMLPPVCVWKSSDLELVVAADFMDRLRL